MLMSVIPACLNLTAVFSALLKYFADRRRAFKTTILADGGALISRMHRHDSWFYH